MIKNEDLFSIFAGMTDIVFGKDEAQYLIFDMEENTLWIAW